MDNLTLEELQVLVRALEKAYINNGEAEIEEKLIASNVYEKAKQAYSDELFESQELPW